MNYYDYRSYFNQIISDLDTIELKQDDLSTLLTEIRTDLNVRLDKINDTLTSTSILISAVVILSAALKVIFR